MPKTKAVQHTNEKILEAARRVFIAKGLHGARMQEIADEAGINKALLHYHFINKEKLFEKIFLEAAGQLIPKLNMILSSDEELFTKVELFCDEYISTILENPYLPLFVLTELNRDPVTFFKKVMGKGNRPDPEKFLLQLEEAIRKGTIRKISPIHLLINMVSMCIFPFVGKPMFQMILDLDEWQYKQMIEQRRKEIPKFIINSISTKQ